MKKSLYDILGVEPGSSEKEIKKAYHNLAKDHHPDKNDGKESQEFVEVTFAYNILKDEAKRREYDTTGNCEAYDIRREAVQALARLFLQVAKDQGWEFEHNNIFEIMQVNLKNALSENERKDRSCCLAIERLEKIEKRISGKDSFFNDIIKSDLRLQEQSRKKLQMDCDMLKKALEILKDYKYKTDGISFLGLGTTSGTTTFGY